MTPKRAKPKRCGAKKRQVFQRDWPTDPKCKLKPGHLHHHDCGCGFTWPNKRKGGSK